MLCAARHRITTESCLHGIICGLGFVLFSNSQHRDTRIGGAPPKREKSGSRRRLLAVVRS